MKKLFGLSAIALMMVGLLTLTACGGGGSSVVNTVALETAIKEANDARYNVKEATVASEVATGLYWVTEAQMTTFNDTIKAAEEVRDIPIHQSAVDAMEVTLKTATEVFNAAKQPGTAAAIKLSGTITIKNNGRPVPFVEIQLYADDTGGWTWWEQTRFPSSGGNINWEIITKPLSESKEVKVNIKGFADDNYDNPLFYIDVRDFTVNVHDKDIDNIVIDLANLKLITLSGTLNITYNGRPIPSVIMQAVSHWKDPVYFGTTSLLNVGNNTPWSMMIEAFETDTEVLLAIYGFKGPNYWDDDQLFLKWAVDYGIVAKNQDMGGINITYDIYPDITLSGTLSVTYGGNTVPYVKIMAFAIDGTNLFNYLGETSTINSPGSNTPWSITIGGFGKDTTVWFAVHGSSDDETVSNYQNYIDWWTPDGTTPYVKRTVKNQNVTGIVLNVGNIDP